MAGRLVQMGKEWQARLAGFFDSPLGLDARPLEICHALLNEVERKVEPLGRGRRVFPYSRIIVRVRHATAERPALDAAFQEFHLRVRERLEELACGVPKELDVKVSFLKKAPAEWADGQLFSIEYQSDVPTLQAREPPRHGSVQVTVVKGAATQDVYSFRESIVSIGRTAESTDSSGRMRRNCVAFLDTVDGVTETVGRAHARLRFDPGTGDYCLFDEGSSNGTCIIRDGATILVPPRDPRGVRVHSGDEVHLGRAVVRVTLAT